MSCFVVTDNHISAIVRYACRENLKAGWRNPHYGYCPGQEQECVDILYEANVKSFNARYQLDDETTGCVYNPSAKELKPIEVIKAIDCLDYQCDEWDGFKDSVANSILESIKQHAVTRLPGYESANWSIA